MDYQFEYNGQLYDYYWTYKGQQKVANWVGSYWDNSKKQMVQAHLHVVNVVEK